MNKTEAQILERIIESEQHPEWGTGIVCIGYRRGGDLYGVGFNGVARFDSREQYETWKANNAHP